MHCLMLLYSRRWFCASLASVRGRISELTLSKGATLWADHQARFYELLLLRLIAQSPKLRAGQKRQGLATIHSWIRCSAQSRLTIG